MMIISKQFMLRIYLYANVIYIKNQILDSFLSVSTCPFFEGDRTSFLCTGVVGIIDLIRLNSV